VTLAEFEQQIFAVALQSSICDIPAVRRLTSTAISLRVGIVSGGFVDAFFNEKTDTTAFAFARGGCRLFGVDNTDDPVAQMIRQAPHLENWTRRGNPMLRQSDDCLAPAKIYGFIRPRSSPQDSDCSNILLPRHVIHPSQVREP